MMASATNVGTVGIGANRSRRRSQAEQVVLRIEVNCCCNDLVYGCVKRLCDHIHIAVLAETVDRTGISKEGYENECIGGLSSDAANGIPDLGAGGVA